MTQQLSTNTFGIAKWIVSSDATQGTHTTIAAALTSASSGDTIAMRPGTYTENLTLKAGVNLVAWPIVEYRADSTASQVIIKGKMTATFTGTACISGIRLQTNSDFFLVVSGTNDTQVNLSNCYLDCLNNTGISYTNSNAGSYIATFFSTGDLGTTGIAYFASSSTGTLRFEYFTGENTGLSTTANTLSAGVLFIYWSQFDHYFSLSGSSASLFRFSKFAAVANATTLTTANTCTVVSENCIFEGGTSSAVSIGAGTVVSLFGGSISSSNTNCITGAGTLLYTALTFENSSSTINVTTQSGGTLVGGKFQAPSAGFLGEQIRSTRASASAITLSDLTAADITSISLTSGIWDVSGIFMFNGAVTGTNFTGSIVTTSATLGTAGDNFVSTPTPPISGVDNCLIIPSYRLTLTSTTTVYLSVDCGFSIGTLKAYGRISATRVG